MRVVPSLRRNDSEERYRGESAVAVRFSFSNEAARQPRPTGPYHTDSSDLSQLSYITPQFQLRKVARKGSRVPSKPWTRTAEMGLLWLSLKEKSSVIFRVVFEDAFFAPGTSTTLAQSLEFWSCSGVRGHSEADQEATKVHPPC